MSEYQCYEFVAVDHPLSAKQMAALRAISTRAEISPTRFWNEYQWGDLRGHPEQLLARYFDAHLYFANWGTRRLMLRLPKARVDIKALGRYFVARDTARLTRVGTHVVLDVTRNSDEPAYYEQNRSSLAALSPLRAELMRGDLRPAYLAWLLAVDADDVDDEAQEPQVPAGLAKLTAAQEAMVEFLQIDVRLVAAAANASAAESTDGASFRRWLAALSGKQKDAWLRRAADEPDLALGGELLRAFRASVKPVRADTRRTAGELRELAKASRVERRHIGAARGKRVKAASGAYLRRLAK